MSRETKTITQRRRRFELMPPPLKRVDPDEKKILVSEIDGLAGAVNACFDSLSPDAKMRALFLADSLSKLRWKLTH